MTYLKCTRHDCPFYGVIHILQICSCLKILRTDLLGRFCGFEKIYLYLYIIKKQVFPFLLLLWGLSDPRIAELCKMPRSLSFKLHSETQVNGRSGMSRAKSPGHAQNPLSGEQEKTLSITHHTSSPPPSHHHLYIIHLINAPLGHIYMIINA